MTDDAALIERLEDGDFSNISEVTARLAELARERFSLCEANDMLLSRAEQAEAERDARTEALQQAMQGLENVRVECDALREDQLVKAATIARLVADAARREPKL